MWACGGGGAARQKGLQVWPSFAQMQTGGGEMLEPCGFLELLAAEASF